MYRTDSTVLSLLPLNNITNYLKHKLHNTNGDTLPKFFKEYQQCFDIYLSVIEKTKVTKMTITLLNEQPITNCPHCRYAF